MSIQEIFEAQQKNRWKMSSTTAGERIERLKTLKRAVLERRDELFDALRADLHKHPYETEVMELQPVLSEINHAMSHLHSWMKPQRAATPLLLFGMSAEVRAEARGVVLILAPWNYPFLLTITPLVASIAAGNCTIVKPSEKSPETTAFINRLIADTFPLNEVAGVEGGPNLAASLLELPFDHFFFTGGGRVGRIVMAAAAKHLASCTLELGGKSPVIVDRTANLKAAAEKIAWGKYVNAGQTCVAPDYVLVDRAVAEPLSAAIAESISKFFGPTAEARRTSADLCRLIDGPSFDRLAETLSDARKRGARVVAGGELVKEDRYIEPTILVDVPPDATIMQEEIFGPLLPIVPFDSLDDAIRTIQSKDKPLALYIFSSNDATIERVLRETSAGDTMINNVVAHFAHPDIPIGGAGPSGIGSYHGEWGFRELSHMRGVVRQGRIAPVRFFYPPYGKKMERLLGMVRRYLG